jgi:hypothetical protein
VLFGRRHMYEICTSLNLHAEANIYIFIYSFIYSALTYHMPLTLCFPLFSCRPPPDEAFHATQEVG